jgi:hypothetical protein
LLHYTNEPPHFRSTWQCFLKGNNKTRFYLLLSKMITCLLKSHATNHSSVFWWLLFNFEMLVLAPTPKPLRDNQSIHSIIRQRLQDLQCGNIELLMEGMKFNNNWKTSSPRPSTRTGNSAAQVAADTNNYCTTITQHSFFLLIPTMIIGVFGSRLICVVVGGFGLI